MLSDIRMAFRAILARPGFSMLAITIIALGIAANTAVFSVVNMVMLRQLPFRDPQRVLEVFGSSYAGLKANDRFGARSARGLREWRDSTGVFSEVATYRTDDFNLAGIDEPERVSGSEVTAEFFDVLGVHASLGRTFLPEENNPDKPAVAVISNRLWRRKFGSSDGVLGKPVSLNGVPVQIVGVLPDGAAYPPSCDLWLASAARPQLLVRSGALSWTEIARLKDHIDRLAALNTLNKIAAPAMEEARRRFGPQLTIELRLTPLGETLSKRIRPSLLLLTGAVAFVMLIVCANVANLLLGRASQRRHEIGIRAALGGSRWRIARELLIESLVLAVAGGAMGLLLGRWGVDALLALRPANLTPVDAVALDWRVAAFSAGIAILSGLLFGTAPAWLGSRADLNTVLKQGGRGSSESRSARWLRNSLVAVEVALAMVLLTGAGLLVRSFAHIMQVNPGFQTERIVSFTLHHPIPPANGSRDKAAQAALDAANVRFSEQALDRLRNINGVESVGMVNDLPLKQGGTFAISVELQGKPLQPGHPVFLGYRVSSEDYFKTMGIPLLAGRTFMAQDAAGALEVAVINQTAAKQLWPNENPLGKQLRNARSDAKWITVVGVTGDLKTYGLDEQTVPEMFLPYRQTWTPTMSFVIRTARDPAALGRDAARAIYELDRTQPVFDVRTLREHLAQSVSGPRFNTLLISIFAVVALLIAAIGLYGVISYSVEQRTREIGIRMALGAESSRILRSVLFDGLRISLIGLAAGAVASFWLTRLIKGMLFEVRPADPWVFAVVASIAIAVAAMAALIPARTASNTDPVIALRWE